MDCRSLGVREEDVDESLPMAKIQSDRKTSPTTTYWSRPHTELELSRHDHAGEPPDVL